ncbi:kinase-like domain-containing protein [Mycena filopes]|nr:kinase-like domain-containing protein [Mycena filopes]
MTLSAACALGNPSQPYRSWTARRPARISSLEFEETFDFDDTVMCGSTAFVLDADPRVVGSGAAVTIVYFRNADVPECAENSVLDGQQEGLGLGQALIDLPQQGLRTVIEFRTLPDGSLHIETVLGPFDPHAQPLVNPLSFPSVPLSSLRCTHVLDSTTHMFLVTLGLSETVLVLKTPQDADSLVEAEFMSCLPETDFVLRPTHVVEDDNGLFRGLLSVYHPASSLCSVLDSLHPDVARPVLVSAGVEATLPPQSVPWSVKLAWAKDVAAALAWLHTQTPFWGDLKTANIVLCTDGHCRLIDYSPGGSTTVWAPPELEFDSLQCSRSSAKGDVFAIGLVLWAIAEEVGSFEREQQDASPLLPWSPHTPHWFRALVRSCLEHEPDRRPSARAVHDAIASCEWLDNSPLQCSDRRDVCL